MKNNNKKAYFSIIISFLMVALYVVTPISYAKHQHNNEVHIQSEDESFNRVTFQEIDHSITPKQPYSGIHNTDGFVIVIKAGRNDSSTVAHQFNHWVGHNNNFGDSAKRLNFAVKGTLNLWKNNTSVAQFDNIVLAQGHSFTDNDWWLGAVNSCKYASGSLICTTTKTKNKWCFKKSDITKYNNKFVVYKGDTCSSDYVAPNIP